MTPLALSLATVTWSGDIAPSRDHVDAPAVPPAKPAPAADRTTGSAPGTDAGPGPPAPDPSAPDPPAPDPSVPDPRAPDPPAPDIALVVPGIAEEPLAGQWPIAQVLAPDALPRPGQPGRGDEQARELARRAYAGLGRDARQEMDGFVERANRAARQMTTAYDGRAGEIVRGHDHGQASIDRAAERAAQEIDGAVTGAQASLDALSGDARRAVEAAGRRAYALIAADDTTAARSISAVVTDLVGGHVRAFNGGIDAVLSASKTTLLALDLWRGRWTSAVFPAAGEHLAAAKFEAQQLHVPRWAEREATEINERVGRTTTAWVGLRDTTVCGLRCGYHDALESQRQRLNAQGRASVAGSLTAARRSLGEQSRTGARLLRDLRNSYLRQLHTHLGAAKSRLNGQARAALDGAHGESLSAIRGVHGAARGALPTYWRGVSGVEQSLRGAAPRGAEVLRLTAERAPAEVLGRLARAGTQLDDRLGSNLLRLRDSLAGRGADFDQRSGEQVAQGEADGAEQSRQAQASCDQNVGGFAESFDRLAGTVSQAAAAWSQTLATRMASFIADRRAEAQAALTRLLTGAPPQVPAGGGGGRTGPAGDAGGEAACGDCAGATPVAGTEVAGTEPAAGSGPARRATEASPGLSRQIAIEVAYLNERAQPDALFAKRLEAVGMRLADGLTARSVAILQKFENGFAGTVDEEGVIAQLRGLTPIKGRALDRVSYPERTRRGTLDSDLRYFLEPDSDDYATASAYLRGDTREGARRELADSVGFFTDDEERIEQTLRALSPDDLRALGRDPRIREDVGDALGGTDRQVFDALLAGEHAKADAYRLRDAVNEARRDNDPDAVHTAIEQYTGAPGESDWRGTQEMSPDARSTEVVTELGRMVADADVAAGAPGRDVSALTARERAEAYVNRAVPVVVEGPGGGMQVEMRALTGANRDLATALLRQGGDSVEARAARLGVEAERTRDAPKTANIDRALYDERFAPDAPGATAEERAANAEQRLHARDDRARVLLLAARYGQAGDPAAAGPLDRSTITRSDFARDDPEVDAARQALISRLRGRYGDDWRGAGAAAGLLTDERLSAQTASLLMQHAMYSRAGTDEDLMFQVTGHMTRGETATMTARFAEDLPEHSLEAELGVYGEGGTFTELSGDDRLRMERLLRGVPQTDRERLENAAFALAQQRRETGLLGTDLAEGTLAEQMMVNTERRLEALAGGPIVLSRRGDLRTPLPTFDRQGGYTGPDREDFISTTGLAQTVAENYAKRVDAFADVATTGLAIVGAIAAAAITVATGGAAAPLIAAAIATGLASMSANYAIKGGRYGWEQAGIDLGMTAVQAVTAGVGAQLGVAAQTAAKATQAASAASRSLSTLARLFTGNPVVDQIIIGAVTGSVGGLANVAFDERTWERQGGDAVGALFSGLLKGALAGAATASLTNSIEALGRNGAAISKRAQEMAERGGLIGGVVGRAGRVVGGAGRRLDAGLNASTGGGALASARGIASRGLSRGVVSGLGGMAGRGTELAYDRAAGRYRGDAGDALLDIGRAGAHSFVQGIGEGAAEAVGQGVHTRGRPRLVTAADAISRARDEAGLPPLAGDPGIEGSPSRTAAEDLLSLNQLGRGGGDRPGLDQVATVRPSAIVEDGMRAALVRHIPPDQHGHFAEVPIRVLPEAEYRRLTRSESGPVVTLIQGGEPVVVVREGTPISRLADEGPHLAQTRDAHTRRSVARLDEATLARWDSLDLDTQLDLYRTKIDLEIDAHRRIHASLDADLARLRASNADVVEQARVVAELDRNVATLRNLRARSAEVDGITPARRAAIEGGTEARPQYLEQPARLFSKDDSTGDRLSPDEPPTPSTEPPEGGPGGAGRSFDPTPEQITGYHLRRERGHGFNTEMEMRFAQEGLRAHHEVRIEKPEKARGYPRVDTFVPGQMLAEQKYTQLAEISVETAIDYINEPADLYHPGARIAEVPSTKTVRAEGDVLRGRSYLVVPEQHAPIPLAVLEHAERVDVIIRDEDGRIYSVAHPAGDDRIRRASARDPERDADAMTAALMRHVPPEQRAAVAGVEIDVLPARDYLALTGSKRGPVVTLVLGGQPRVVIREGTPISRLSDEGPHLTQAIEGPTRERVRRLDEAVLARWHELDLDTQLELYQIKIDLEIDAHERIQRSLESENPKSEKRQAHVLAEMDRTEQTLRNLRARRAEVETLGPTERAAIRSGRKRAQYLDQPARLFSKDAPGGRPPVPTDEQRTAARATRTERKLGEREERRLRRETRAARREAEEQQARARQEAVERRRTAIDAEVSERRRAVEEGRVSPEEDLRERLAAVAAELDVDIEGLIAAVMDFTGRLGGSGRRFDAQDVIDSLRNRIRDKAGGRPPRYGNLEGLVSESIVAQNAVAVQQMREHIAASRPNAILGVERGGAFLAEVLSAGAGEGSPATVAVPKHVRARAGEPDLVQRTPGLDAEIRRRVTDEGQTRFTIVDFYMGGVFAGELQTMIAKLVHDHPQVEVEVLWMRETHGFERVTFRPTAAEAAEGVAFTGSVRLADRPRRPPTSLGLGHLLPSSAPRLWLWGHRASPAIVLPALRGTTDTAPGVRSTHFPVDMVLGDDVRAVLDRSPTEPVRVFDRTGRIVREIPVGTPDPETGEPLPTTRDIMIRLMLGVRFETGRTPTGGPP